MLRIWLFVFGIAVGVAIVRFADLAAGIGQ